MDIPLEHISTQNPLIKPLHTAVKGRARYKVSGLRDSESFKRYLEFRLSEETIVTQARANHLTGNVLVFFHPDCSLKAIALLIQDIVLDYKVATGEYGETAKLQTPVLAATIPEHSLQEEVDKTGAQIAMVAGTASALVLLTAALHKSGLDTVILLAIQKLHTPLLDQIMIGITFLGEPKVFLPLCFGLATWLRSSRRPLQAKILGITTVGAISLNFLLKTLFRRARPELWNRLIHVGYHSFPSGHAMVSMAIYGFIGYLLAKDFPQYRKQIIAVTIILIAAIGFTRLYLGVHWPTDVVAGYAAGLVWLFACIRNLELKQQYSLISAPVAV